MKDQNLYSVELTASVGGASLLSIFNGPRYYVMAGNYSEAAEKAVSHHLVHQSEDGILTADGDLKTNIGESPEYKAKSVTLISDDIVW